jgi:hypothetical protein
MDIERVIDEIEQLEEMFEAPDIRPFSASDISAANRRHDEALPTAGKVELNLRGNSVCQD